MLAVLAQRRTHLVLGTALQIRPVSSLLPPEPGATTSTRLMYLHAIFGSFSTATPICMMDERESPANVHNTAPADLNVQTKLVARDIPKAT